MAAVWVLIGGIGGAVRIAFACAVTAALAIVYTHIVAIPNAVSEAKSSYASELRTETAKQLAEEVQRQTKAYQTVIDAYQTQYRNALTAQAARNEEIEKDIAENEKSRSAEGRACPLSQSDIDFLRK